MSMTGHSRMDAPNREKIVTNAAWASAQPTLSVLTPFLRDDPTPLIAALGKNPTGAEIIILDDGTNDDALADKVAKAVEDCPAPACFIRSYDNLGRSKGRNRLISMARAKHVLFLDADMLPDDAQFLARYDELIRAKNPAVVFGGFSDLHAPDNAATALHRALARTSDCRPAAERNLHPGKTICTSNLLVRRDVIEAIQFDEGFKGWGWEDVDWGLRAAEKFDVLHIDNMATHLGLETPKQLLTKFSRSGGNFQRLAMLHPKEVQEFSSYRAAKLMARVPLRDVVKKFCSYVVEDPLRLIPMRLRLAALKIYRACSYAEHFPANRGQQI